jgi:hypothetical protein
MSEFPTVKPHAVIFTAINNYAAFCAEVDSIHDFAADGTFNVERTVTAGSQCTVNAVKLASVNAENIGNSSLQQRFQLIWIKE